jgi:hypothetical protein
VAILNVRNRYLDLDPVIVTSPTTRCGTTLVQRLLNSSKDAFIYGEEIGHEIQLLANWLGRMVRFTDLSGAALNADFQRALSGDQSSWRPGLTPPPEVLLKAWGETFYQLPAHLAEYSRSVGRTAWGFKYPGLAPDMIEQLLVLMPRAKIVYIFRNAADALRSAKARKFVRSSEEVAQFCALWATNLRGMASLSEEQRILFLKYEDLIHEPGDHTAALELFTGTSGADLGVFDQRINTFEGVAAEGFSPSQYIPPAPLTGEERSALHAHAAAVMERLYGEDYAG